MGHILLRSAHQHSVPQVEHVTLVPCLLDGVTDSCLDCFLWRKQAVRKTQKSADVCWHSSMLNVTTGTWLAGWLTGFLAFKASCWKAHGWHGTALGTQTACVISLCTYLIGKQDGGVHIALEADISTQASTSVCHVNCPVNTNLRSRYDAHKVCLEIAELAGRRDDTNLPRADW